MATLPDTPAEARRSPPAPRHDRVPPRASRKLPDWIHENDRINLPMTRTEIADFLGLTPETVSRVLTGLAREKIITVGVSHTLCLLNPGLLQHISGH